jgi:hypothetical protein
MSDDSAPIPWHVYLVLVLLGALGGALASIPLTWLGKILAGAPPADFANFRWNAVAFAVIGGFVSPGLTAAVMRRAPVWRAVAEPAVGALLGLGVGVLLVSMNAFIGLAALGAALAVWRLNYASRHAVLPPSAAPVNLLPLTSDELEDELRR